MVLARPEGPLGQASPCFPVNWLCLALFFRSTPVRGPKNREIGFVSHFHPRRCPPDPGGRRLASFWLRFCNRSPFSGHKQWKLGLFCVKRVGRIGSSLIFPPASGLQPGMDWVLGGWPRVFTLDRSYL